MENSLIGAHDDPLISVEKIYLYRTCLCYTDPQINDYGVPAFLAGQNLSSGENDVYKSELMEFV